MVRHELGLRRGLCLQTGMELAIGPLLLRTSAGDTLRHVLFGCARALPIRQSSAVPAAQLRRNCRRRSSSQPRLLHISVHTVGAQDALRLRLHVYAPARTCATSSRPGPADAPILRQYFRFVPSGTRSIPSGNEGASSRRYHPPMTALPLKRCYAHSVQPPMKRADRLDRRVRQPPNPTQHTRVHKGEERRTAFLVSRGATVRAGRPWRLHHPLVIIHVATRLR